MKRGARGIQAKASVREAALLMREIDCEFLPVLRDGHVQGVVTDRDLLFELSRRNCGPSELTVGEVASRTLWTCREDDDVRTALETMRDHRVRHLPVTEDHVLRGVLSIDDVVSSPAPAGLTGIDAALETLRAISRPDYPSGVKTEDNLEFASRSAFG